MAWFDEESEFQFGKHKGKKVKEVHDPSYVSWLHHSFYNVFFTDEVLNRMGVKVTSNAKRRKNKREVRYQ